MKEKSVEFVVKGFFDGSSGVGGKVSLQPLAISEDLNKLKTE